MGTKAANLQLWTPMAWCPRGAAVPFPLPASITDMRPARVTRIRNAAMLNKRE